MYIYPTVDMEGKLLKIRLKMISLFLIIILIPLIFLYVYLSKISMDQVSASQVQALKNINETKADYKCNCSRRRTENALSAINKKELENMVSELPEIEVKCRFCGACYKFTKDEIEKIIKK